MVIVPEAGTILGLPSLTNTPDQTKRTIRMGGSDAYQSLPDFSQAWHKPLVILDWSTKVYHPADLGLTFGHCAFTKYYVILGKFTKYYRRG